MTVNSSPQTPNLPAEAISAQAGSKPQTKDYEYVKKSYRSKGQADTYDSKRFQTSWGKVLNRKFLSALLGVLNYIRQTGSPLDAIIDMPCGTGRAYPALLSKDYSFFGSDISLEMMIESRKKLVRTNLNLGRLNRLLAQGGTLDASEEVPLIQTDMERTSFKDNSFDVIICLRFFTMRVSPQARLAIFKEMRRISRGWVILECQHTNPVTEAVNQIATDVLKRKPVYRYFTKDKIQQELKQAGIQIERIFNPYGILSNKWLVLGKVIKSV